MTAYVPGDAVSRGPSHGFEGGIISSVPMTWWELLTGMRTLRYCNQCRVVSLEVQFTQVLHLRFGLIGCHCCDELSCGIDASLVYG